MPKNRFRESVRVRLSATLHARLEEFTTREGATNSEVIRAALRDYLSDGGPSDVEERRQAHE